jgi:hypothetical protein
VHAIAISDFAPLRKTSVYKYFAVVFTILFFLHLRSRLVLLGTLTRGSGWLALRRDAELEMGAGFSWHDEVNELRMRDQVLEP